MANIQGDAIMQSMTSALSVWNSDFDVAAVDDRVFFAFVKKHRGWVYLADHPLHPELLKIGFTRASPAKRMETLSGSAGVRGMFQLRHSAMFVHCAWAEEQVHQLLTPYRVEKEFFRCSLEQAKIACSAIVALETRKLGARRATALYAPHVEAYQEQLGRAAISDTAPGIFPGILNP